MSKLVRTIFDTVIAKIDEGKRQSILAQLYAESDNTRAVFLAQAKKIAETTVESKVSVAKEIRRFSPMFLKRYNLFSISNPNPNPKFIEDLLGISYSKFIKTYLWYIY